MYMTLVKVNVKSENEIDDGRDYEVEVNENEKMNDEEMRLKGNVNENEKVHARAQNDQSCVQNKDLKRMRKKWKQKQ